VWPVCEIDDPLLERRGQMLDVSTILDVVLVVLSQGPAREQPCGCREKE
jgi:hypothetical protein